MPPFRSRRILDVDETVLKRAAAELNQMLADQDAGAIHLEQLGALAHLRGVVTITLKDADIDTSDPAVLLALLVEIDAYARRHPDKGSATPGGSITNQVRAISIMIRLRIDNPVAIEARRDRVKQELGIGQRELYKSRRLGDFQEAYVRYIVRVLSDSASQRQIVDRLKFTTQDQAAQQNRLTPGALPVSRRRPTRRTITLVAAVAFIVIVVVATLLVQRRDATDSHTNRSDASELERRYDGKNPRGDDGDESKCADPPPSQTVIASEPPVLAPTGDEVGRLQLRSSPTCPTVLWARLLWNHDENATYVIPAGWTVHLKTHRPDTDTVRDDDAEPSQPTPVPYLFSTMLSSARGCVYVQAYFTRGDQTSTQAATSCVRAE